MHGPAPRWYVDRCLCVACVAGGGGKGGELSRKSNQRVRSHRPAGTLRVLAFLFQGGGISVGSGGVANLNGCQVYENVASYVRSRYEPSHNLHPSPLWNLASLSRLAGRWRLCRFQRSGKL